MLAAEDVTPAQYAKLVMDRESGTLRGVALLGEGAGEAIALAAALLAAGARGSDFTAATAVHPSFSEEFVGR